MNIIEWKILLSSIIFMLFSSFFSLGGHNGHYHQGFMVLRDWSNGKAMYICNIYIYILLRIMYNKKMAKYVFFKIIPTNRSNSRKLDFGDNFNYMEGRCSG